MEWGELTNLVLARFDDQSEFVFGVFRSFVLLSHDASSYKQQRSSQHFILPKDESPGCPDERILIDT